MDEPRIARIDPAAPDRAIVAEAVALLRGGHLLVVPTETVYGLACLPSCEGAEERVYRAKGRPKDKPLPRMVADVGEVTRRAADWPDAAERLARRYWPGPLTLVVRTVEDGDVAFRVPDHPVMLALLEAAGEPLAVTSANRSDEPDTCTADEARTALAGHVALVLDAGPVRLARPSTVVDVRDGEVRVLREGVLSRKEVWTSAGDHGR